MGLLVKFQFLVKMMSKSQMRKFSTRIFSTELLPHAYRKLAFGAIGVGVLLLYFYFKGKRPSFLEINTFALASTYLEKRFFVMIKTNLLDELGFIFSLIGIALLVLTKEQNETSKLNDLRLASLLFSIKTTLMLWILAYITLYGYIIFMVTNFIFIVFLLIYYFRLRYLLSTNNKHN